MDCPAEPRPQTGALVELDAESRPWFEFVASRPEATPFHHPAWMRAVAASYEYPGSVLALVAAGQVLAGMPVLAVSRPLARKRLISLPFSDHVPALAADPLWRQALVEAAVEWARERRLTLEVRGDLGSTPGVERQIAGVRHVVPLSADPAELMSRLDRDVTRRLKNQRREGLEVSVGCSEEARAQFYRLHLETRQRLGVPIQPRRFFERLWERVLAPGLGFCVVVSAGRRPLAAAVFLRWNGTVVYKYSASDAASWRLAPNHLLLWTAIERACQSGDSELDLGRTDFDNAGLRRFKSQWAASEVPLITSAVGMRPAARSQGMAHRVLGTVIRRSPSAVCRVTGEALYRYFP